MTHADVAQLGERQAASLKDAGSTPAVRLKCPQCGMAQHAPDRLCSARPDRFYSARVTRSVP